MVVVVVAAAKVVADAHKVKAATVAAKTVKVDAVAIVAAKAASAEAKAHVATIVAPTKRSNPSHATWTSLKSAATALSTVRSK